MQRQMERLKKKADIIADDSDISERQKSQQIQQLFKKIKKVCSPFALFNLPILCCVPGKR